MKSWSFILAGVFLIFLTSLKPTEIEYAEICRKAPLFKVEKDSVSTELQLMKGKYVLVNFWGSKDALSRINNKMYDSKLKNEPNISLVSINLDEDKSLYDQIVLTDKLNTESQYSVLDVTVGDIFADYHLKSGFKSFLINPEGEIIEINPTIEELAKVIS